MRLFVNGEETILGDVCTVAQLLKAVNPAAARVAVLVNDAVVKTEERGTHVLRDRDRIEILTFAGGG